MNLSPAALRSAPSHYGSTADGWGRVDQRHLGVLATPERAYRALRLTARASALLFTAAHITRYLGPYAGRSPAPQLYRAFLAAHSLHFAAVARYAVLTNGRSLFPGGRGLRDVGGWPTMAAIYALFGVLAAAGRIDPAAAAGDAPRTRAVAAGTAIGTMFTGTYLGQTARSPWFGALAGATALGTVAAAQPLARRPGADPPHSPVALASTRPA